MKLEGGKKGFLEEFIVRCFCGHHLSGAMSYERHLVRGGVHVGNNGVTRITSHISINSKMTLIHLHAHILLYIVEEEELSLTSMANIEKKSL